MNTAKFVLALLSTGLSCLAQGQVVFANKVGTTVDAPIIDMFTQRGPGPSYSAQLYLVNPNNSLAPLLPATTFRPAGTGAAAIADRYWVTQTVDVPVQPGSDATFVVRVWLTSQGGYDQATFKGQSDQFIVSVGGGTLPPSNLTTLKAFIINGFPEPSTIAIGLLGAAVLLLGRKR